MDDWLTEELDNYLDDDYLVFDCPGTCLFPDNCLSSPGVLYNNIVDTPQSLDSLL